MKPSSSHLVVSHTQQAQLFGGWSAWSRCSRHCQQTKRRRCRSEAKCGRVILKEKRPCNICNGRKSIFRQADSPNEISFIEGKKKKYSASKRRYHKKVFSS